jgi:transposase InsO family protein
VARLMREAGLEGVSRRKWICTTQRRPDARPAPDLVERNFTADEPDQLYVADITYGAPSTGKRLDDADWALSMFGIREDNRGRSLSDVRSLL